jgi:hypothetical protein
VAHAWPTTVQSGLVVQHVPFGMHALLALHGCWFAGQLHVPPGPEHVWPLNGQSALVQQLPFGMQLFDVGQTFWPPGHAHVPPGPEHT